MSPTTDTDTIAVSVIVGSTREGRRGRSLADWVLQHLRQRHDLELDEIDLAVIDLPNRITSVPAPEVRAFAERVAAADAFVVITPEYNHSFPAPLKQAIDLVRDPWHRKPVAFVSYGGVSGGLRAVEQLRLVFEELQAHSIRDTVSFHGPWNGFDADGTPVDLDGASTALDALGDELVWWASALRAARAGRMATAIGSAAHEPPSR